MSQALPPDVNLGPMILGVHWSFFAICVILVALRFYVRTRLRPGNLGWDDWYDMRNSFAFHSLANTLLW